MNILVLNTSILAVNPVDAVDTWQTADQIIPKHIAPDAELIDAELPEGFTIADYEWNGTEVVKKPVVITDAQRKELTTQIDSDVDAIYSAVQGQRGTEYLRTEQEAQEYKDSGYTAPAPITVTAWADATGNTAQWAADDILATASFWRTCQAQIRTQRLKNKQDARILDDLGTVKAEWDAFVVQMRTALEI